MLYNYLISAVWTNSRKKFKCNRKIIEEITSATNHILFTINILDFYNNFNTILSHEVKWVLRKHELRTLYFRVNVIKVLVVSPPKIMTLHHILINILLYFILIGIRLARAYST